jgi:hypothetical protein
MDGPGDYYEEGEAELFPEQCTRCESYVEADSDDGLCSDCRDAASEG